MTQVHVVTVLTTTDQETTRETYHVPVGRDEVEWIKARKRRMALAGLPISDDWEIIELQVVDLAAVVVVAGMVDEREEND